MNSANFYSLLRQSYTADSSHSGESTVQRQGSRSPAPRSSSEARSSSNQKAQKLFAEKSPMKASAGKPATIYRSPLYSNHLERSDRSFSNSRVSNANLKSYGFEGPEQDYSTSTCRNSETDRLCGISRSLIDQITRLERESQYVPPQTSEQTDVENILKQSDLEVVAPTNIKIVEPNEPSDASERLAKESSAIEPQKRCRTPVREPASKACKQVPITKIESRSTSGSRASSKGQRAAQTAKEEIRRAPAAEERSPIEQFQEMYELKQRLRREQSTPPKKAVQVVKSEPAPVKEIEPLPEKKKPIKPTRTSRQKAESVSETPVQQPTMESCREPPININVTLRSTSVEKNAHYDLEAYKKPVFDRLADPEHFTGHYKEIYRNPQKEVTNSLELKDTLREGVSNASDKKQMQERERATSAPKAAHFGTFSEESLDYTRITNKTTHYDENGEKMSVFDRLSSPKYFTGRYKQIYRTQAEQLTDRQQMLRADLSQFVRPYLNHETRDTSKYRPRSAFERSSSRTKTVYAHQEPPIYEKLTNKDFYSGTAFNTATNGRFCKDYAGSTFLPRSFRNMTSEQRAYFEYMNYINRDSKVELQ